jgi:hypothetical protein
MLLRIGGLPQGSVPRAAGTMSPVANHLAAGRESDPLSAPRILSSALSREGRAETAAVRFPV